ncbi:hypothetical protein HY994_00795 [Candidatus Micrarchaeota archaeon]|nr:hypothetical protein [Candidatus Micrarchaeota archaeon]
MDLVVKSYAVLAVLIALAGGIPYDQLIVFLGIGYLAVGNTIALSGTPVY